MGKSEVDGCRRWHKSEYITMAFCIMDDTP